MWKVMEEKEKWGCDWTQAPEVGCRERGGRGERGGWVDRVGWLCPLLTPQLLAPIRSTLQTWGKPSSGASGLSECGQHASAGALGVYMDHPLWNAGGFGGVHRLSFVGCRGFWSAHGPSSMGCGGLWECA